MKLVQSLIVAAALAIPAVSSFAQASQPANGDSVAVSSTGGAVDGSSASGHHPLRTFDHAVARVGRKINASVRPDANDGMKPVFFGS